MTGKLAYFLLVFDHGQGHLVYQEEFHDSTKAVEAYFAMEEQHRDDRNVETVLIGSDSIETVRITHANYFDGTVATSRFLVGI
jgi:hypothetical protein